MSRKETVAMIAVIAENYLKDGQEQEFLDITASIRPLIEKMDGFLSVERFESLSEPGKILSLSFWRDEQALLALRHFEPHRAAEVKGRADVLKDYRIRVAHVVRDYGMFDREQAPLDS
jgi:heme-degrading monooxygenase HmoA